MLNREIKFRAWDGGSISAWEEMAYSGMPHTCGSDKEFHVHLMDIFHDIGHAVIFMQFTGLMDKNGKEVYEGDVVRFGDLGEEGTGEFELGAVVYEKAAFVLKRIKPVKWIDWPSEYFEDCEVVGNVYENPQLLK